jgi:hypothetical protein
MASGYTMLALGILWLTNFLILMLFTIAGGIVFNMLAYVASLVPGTVLTYDTVQFIFPAFYFFLIVTLVVISYKLYQEAFSETVYIQGY